MEKERRRPSSIFWAAAFCLGLAGMGVSGCDRPRPDTSASPSASAKDTLVVGAVFSADPNPVPPGNPKGRTTITWDTGTDAVGEVYVVSGESEKLFASGRQGSQEAPWIQPGPNEFRLYDQADHKLLGRLTVTMAGPDSSANRPPATSSSAPTP